MHGLAASYLGFSVAFGHSMIRWADHRVHHWFAGGPPPPKSPGTARSGSGTGGANGAKCLLAVAIAGAVMLFLIFIVATPAHTRALWFPPGWIPRLGAVVAIWFVAGPLWTSLSRN